MQIEELQIALDLSVNDDWKDTALFKECILSFHTDGCMVYIFNPKIRHSNLLDDFLTYMSEFDNIGKGYPFQYVYLNHTTKSRVTYGEEDYGLNMEFHGVIDLGSDDFLLCKIRPSLMRRTYEDTLAYLYTIRQWSWKLPTKEELCNIFNAGYIEKDHRLYWTKDHGLWYPYMTKDSVQGYSGTEAFIIPVKYYLTNRDTEIVDTKKTYDGKWYKHEDGQVYQVVDPDKLLDSDRIPTVHCQVPGQDFTIQIMTMSRPIALDYITSIDGKDFTILEGTHRVYAVLNSYLDEFFTEIDTKAIDDTESLITLTIADMVTWYWAATDTLVGIYTSNGDRVVNLINSSNLLIITKAGEVVSRLDLEAHGLLEDLMDAIFSIGIRDTTEFLKAIS